MPEDGLRRLNGPERRPEAGANSPVPYAAAEAILGTACAHAEGADDAATDPPAFAGKSFLRKRGLTGIEAKRVAWTPALIRRGLEVYAGCAREEPEAFRREVGIDLDERAEDLTRRVACLEREVATVVWLLDGSASRKRAAKLLPGDGRDERIAKYERHLHTLLISTLHELERLQARREGEAVPPAVADVTVTVGTTAD